MEEMGRGSNVEYTYASFKVEDGKAKMRFENDRGEPSARYIPVDLVRSVLNARGE